MRINNRFSAKINETIFACPIEQQQRDKDQYIYYWHAAKIHHAEQN
jgi:hypothetical protein